MHYSTDAFLFQGTLDGVHVGLHVRVNARVGLVPTLPAAKPRRPSLASEKERRDDIVQHQADADVPAAVLITV